MLKIGIVDANDTPNNLRPKYSPIGVVGNWLLWECSELGVEVVEPQNAELVFFCYAGAIGWKQRIGGAVRHYKWGKERPYIISGGQSATIPTMVLKYVDALAVGEAFTFVRTILKMVIAGDGIVDINQWITEYPHAIAASQLDYEEDVKHPYLLKYQIEPYASPDTFIDWNIPPIRCADKVARIVVSKGCPMKCKFCATSYSQEYNYNKRGGVVAGMLQSLASQKQRTIVVSNDVAALPYYEDMVATGSLQVQSLSFRAIAKGNGINITTGMKNNMVRLGVEGVSERIRKAVGKPIANDKLLAALVKLHRHGVKTHLFFVSGLPFETEDDYEDHRQLLRLLAINIDRCIMRIKYTTFNPTPPAPLVRFIQGVADNERASMIRNWFMNNAASRHIMIVKGKQNKSWRKDVSELLDVNIAVVDTLQPESGVIDLTPKEADFIRLKQNIINWPIPARTCWILGNKYKQMMSDN